MTLKKTLKTVLDAEDIDVSKSYEDAQATQLSIDAAYALVNSQKSMADKCRDLKILHDALDETKARGAYEVGVMLDLAKSLCAFESMARDADMHELRKACGFLLRGEDYADIVPSQEMAVKAARLVLEAAPQHLRKNYPYPEEEGGNYKGVPAHLDTFSSTRDVINQGRLVPNADGEIILRLTAPKLELIKAALKAYRIPTK